MMIAALLTTTWIMSQPASNPALARVMPEVHSVTVLEKVVEVRSAGLTLHPLGALQPPRDAAGGVAEFVFRLPRFPEAAKQGLTLPPGIVGVFANGVPVYNLAVGPSYQDQNLWHYDPVRQSAEGLPQCDCVLGFALDGFPIYGRLHAPRSSYRLRKMTHRTTWPDGTVLTPAQYGPDPGAEYPLGTFAEDYEYVAGAGDLDASNGRAEADGTYAYYLTGTYPYLIADRFHGRVEVPAPDQFTFNPGARHLEYVHEKPVHLIIVSDDLAEFAHVHPEPVAGGRYETAFTFPRAGHYRLFYDYTPPGGPGRVDRRDVTVPGPAAKAAPDAPLFPSQFTAGRDELLTFQPPDGIEPYLGAWAHFIAIDDSLDTYLHAHAICTNKPNLPHTHASLGPPPEEISAAVVFPHAGRYKLWIQYQRAGRVETLPYFVQVAAAQSKPAETVTIPQGAIRVRVSGKGFEPAKLEIPAGRAVTLAITRENEPNCGRQIVFPALGIKKDLPLGGTVLIELPAEAAGEYQFACGMNMYRGLLVVK